mmetsp:Transcript_24547/g.47737  ORF Transcript_24547/g.47737 Transcript_24547/m.47737 type:complete len:419 (-) Transcript_24547:124-1380(-)|eukprot:CAMPEP_0172701150 /NCGR_PEP_ID=MMETSP1074-20121228/31430_1 /TAXON_ID=2916 /ORGANISM="Ceratium fusus, Strain PA161109" /LENGTH=418 /DNA_ID=CAMNT_0013522659 /DNA_START=6 /DNA_END=1262 /DNA_ORIENTATION=+
MRSLSKTILFAFVVPQPQGLSSRRRLRGGHYVAVQVGPNGQFESLAEQHNDAETLNRWHFLMKNAKMRKRKKASSVSNCPHLLSHDDVSVSGEPFANTFWGHLKRQCPTNQAIVSVRSFAAKKLGDRLWTIACAPLKGHGVSLSSCEWTKYSTPGKPFDLPANRELAVITGIEGHYDKGTHDRRLKFKYCNVGGVRLHENRNDPSWKNKIHKDFKLEEPKSEWLTGWVSDFVKAGRWSDRLFSFGHATFCLNPIDCQLDSWTFFSECNKPCGGGSHVRTRTISVKAYNGGACPPLKEHKRCNSQACATDCQVDAWTSFGECSQTCGPGHHIRKRKVNIATAHGGKACPKVEEVQDCNTGDCPKEEVQSSINMKIAAAVALGVLLVSLCLVIRLRNPKGPKEEKAKGEKRNRKNAYGDL